MRPTFNKQEAYEAFSSPHLLPVPTVNLMQNPTFSPMPEGYGPAPIFQPDGTFDFGNWEQLLTYLTDSQGHHTNPASSSHSINTISSTTTSILPPHEVKAIVDNIYKLATWLKTVLDIQIPSTLPPPPTTQFWTKDRFIRSHPIFARLYMHMALLMISLTYRTQMNDNNDIRVLSSVADPNIMRHFASSAYEDVIAANTGPHHFSIEAGKCLYDIKTKYII